MVSFGDSSAREIIDQFTIIYIEVKGGRLALGGPTGFLNNIELNDDFTFDKFRYFIRGEMLLAD